MFLTIACAKDLYLIGMLLLVDFKFVVSEFTINKHYKLFYQHMGLIVVTLMSQALTQSIRLSN